jgi:hypothetical protein
MENADTIQNPNFASTTRPCVVSAWVKAKAGPERSRPSLRGFCDVQAQLAAQRTGQFMPSAANSAAPTSRCE